MAVLERDQAKTTPSPDGEAPTVEVLIVSYNTRSVLRDCLRSIEANPPRAARLSVAVWDNASTDSSPEMVAEEFAHVRLILSRENIGFGAANNRLAETSSATYLLLCNSDTVWLCDLVTPLLDCLRSHPRAIAAGPRLVLPNGKRQASISRFPRLWHELVPLAEGILNAGGAPWADRLLGRTDGPAARETEVLWATCWLLRRSDVATYGLFDEAFTVYDEDIDFCWRMAAQGRTVVYEPRVTLLHRSGASADPVSRSALMRRSRELLYRRHRGRATSVCYRRLMSTVSLVGRLTSRRDG